MSVATTTLPAPAPAPSGPALYADVLQAAQIPGTAAASIDPQDAVIRDLYLDLAAVDAQLAAHPAPLVLTIYADTLHVPAGYSRTLDGSGLVVFARQIVVDGTAALTLDFTNSPAARVVVYCSRLDGSLSVSAKLPDGTSETQGLVFGGAKGALASLVFGRLNVHPLSDVSHPVFGPSPDLEASLVSIFQVATALFDTQPGVAAGMLAWIVSCTAAYAGLEEMCVQASGLLTLLDAGRGGNAFVPYLSRDVYVDTAAAYATAAAAYEQQYQRFADSNQAIDDRIAAAKLMSAGLAAQAAFQDKLIEQGLQNVTDALNAVQAAQANVRAQQIRISDARVQFEVAVKNWQVDKVMEGIVDVTLALVEIGVTLGAALVDPAALVAVPGDIANAAVTVEKQAEAVKAAIERIKAIVEALNQVATIARTLYKEVSPKFDPASAGPALAQIDQLTGTLGSGADLQGATDQWAIFRLSADSVMDASIQAGLPMAAEYKLALDMLTVYGQSVCASQLAAATAQQELARMLLQRQLVATQQAQLAGYIAAMSAAEPPNTAAMQAFYQSYLDRKRWLFIALENYCRAYTYWALRPPGFTPSIVQSVAELTDQLAGIATDYENALAGFSPAPQKLPIGGISLTIDDAASLAQLKQTSTLDLVIGLDESAFRGLSRVRIDTVRVYFEGAEPPGQNGGTAPIYALMSTSGTYQDRLGAATYTFSAAPLTRAFEYRPGQEASPLIDGTLDDEVRYAYFVPTPFTQWRFTLPAKYNPALDLSGVQRVVVDFGGTGIPDE